MANAKISALTALTGANVDTAADLACHCRYVRVFDEEDPVDELRNAMGPALSTEQATTSGTSIDFTSIPTWVKKITMQLVGVSTNGTSNLLMQLGDSGGVETSGYLGSAVGLTNGLGSRSRQLYNWLRHPEWRRYECESRKVVITLEDSTQFTWVATGLLGYSDSAAFCMTPALNLPRQHWIAFGITTVNGSDTFDAGAINVLYE
jgi:hypothetical protein